MKKNLKKQPLLQLRGLFFCFVLFCFFGHGQSVTLAFVECVMNYTPPLLCLCCGEVPAVCTSYNILRCEFSMPVYQPGLFWTGIEKWVFWKVSLMVSPICFSPLKKFVWTLPKCGLTSAPGPVLRGAAFCLLVCIFQRMSVRLCLLC